MAANERQAVPQPHPAARLEDVLPRTAEPRPRQRARQITIIPYTGYGNLDWVRVLCRIVLARPDPRRSRAAKVRGWRSFTSRRVRDARVEIEAAGRIQEARTDRAGFVDCVVDVSATSAEPGTQLSPGWATVRLSVEGAETVEAPVRIVDLYHRLAEAAARGLEHVRARRARAHGGAGDGCPV
jgi:hypothetical protein